MSTLKSKSPAEFFAEHQNIAGFDNAGKSLYTTIREFVENSLDAAEAINELPEVTVTVEKLSSAEFNTIRGIKSKERGDLSLYQDYGPSKKTKKRKAENDAKKPEEGDSEEMKADDGKKNATKKEEKEGKGYGYFRVSCKDNGMGMPHDKIPQMLGVVLSSTKYGVKQTRGKFGLGAKMALVWSKKSTGFPIEVWSSRDPEGSISYCKLDIDIYKNQPKVLAHEKLKNDDKWRGTEIKVVIGGNWTFYQAKVISYMRQLAVITPYAHLVLKFIDQDGSKKSFTLKFSRRSDVMPPQAQEVKHHPSAVDNLLVESLIHHTKADTLEKFLQKEFTSITKEHSIRLIDELGGDFSPKMAPQSLKKKHIHQLTQLLKEAKFKAPNSECLSPAGEYNLRLGIIKEISPELVATASEPAAVYEGHPFVVEAAVSLGGKGKQSKPGITVYRFANRIPLLFEAGNDVVTQVANKKIRWGQYKVKNTDRIGVYCSIVSTKVPFKGTSKEYIGDDKGVMSDTIQSALCSCLNQLKKQIAKKNLLKDQLERKKLLIKYIPNVCNSLNNVLTKMAGIDESKSDSKAVTKIGSVAFGPNPKRKDLAEKFEQPLIKAGIEYVSGVKNGELTVDQLQKKLKTHVEQIDSALALDAVMASGRAQSAGDLCFIQPLDKESLQPALYGPKVKLQFF